MGLETDLYLNDDERFRERKFEEPDFMRFRSLYIATSVIRNAEDLLPWGAAVTLRRVVPDGVLSIDVDDQVLKVWHGFAMGAYREAVVDGQQDVADAVLRRALRGGER